MRRRSLIALAAVVATSLVSASPALAITHAGEGLWGPTNDETVTYAMFICMSLIGVIILVFSLIQSWLNHREHARLDAAKARESAPEWKGGW